MSIGLQIKKIRRHTLRAIKGPGTLESTAKYKEVLCAEETEDIAPVAFLPGQLEKITGAPADSTKAAEIEFVTRTTAIHAPTIAYHFHNVVLVDGSVYVDNFRHYISDRRSITRRKELPVAALTSTPVGIKYFAHWLKDDCTMRFLAETVRNPICATRLPYPHLREYADMFQQNWQDVTDRARIDHLVIFQDYSQNSLKRQRYEILRSRVAAKIERPGQSPFIYLRRGKTGAARLIENEREIMNALAKAGFVIVDVGSDSLETILRTLIGAKIVVSMEGSHCGHCVMSMPKHSGLIVLQPPNRFTGNQRGWADCLSIRSGLVVGDETNFGTRFSARDILKTVDLMSKIVRNS